MFNLLNLFTSQATPERRAELLKQDNELFRQNGLEIVGTLSFDEGFLSGTTVSYTLKKGTDASGVYTGCVVHQKGHDPAIVGLKRL